jgi:hypothetical protein
LGGHLGSQVYWGGSKNFLQQKGYLNESPLITLARSKVCQFVWEFTSQVWPGTRSCHLRRTTKRTKPGSPQSTCFPWGFWNERDINLATWHIDRKNPSKGFQHCNHSLKADGRLENRCFGFPPCCAPVFRRLEWCWDGGFGEKRWGDSYNPGRNRRGAAPLDDQDTSQGFQAEIG